ncbi:MAG: hypothetical protein NT066_01310 [Candidatus Omnitrophica bacterium]|nr:hypothetical protein [Candidatus Omnitrophota bacterium]
MENKAKFIIIGLAGVAVIFIFLFMQSLNSKQALQKEKDKLMADNMALAQKAEDNQRKAQQVEGQLSSMNSELDRLTKEKDGLGKRLDVLNKEKEGLIEELKSQKSTVAVKQEPQQQPQPPVTEDAYWAGILKAKTDLELQLGSVRSELKAIQINNEQLQREKSTLGLDINGLKRDREDLKRQLDYNQKIMDSIAQDLVRERNDKVQIQDSLKVIRNENILLRRQLNSLNSRKINLDKKLQELQEGKAAIERRFTEMETMLSQKVTQVGSLQEQLQAISSQARIEKPEDKKESVDLPAIIVRPQAQENTLLQEQPISSKVSGEGKVLAINKENNFLIIDLGEDAGIKLGDTFQIYRDNEAIAAIVVIQTRKDIAACDIKQQIAPIEIGDAIR